MCGYIPLSKRLFGHETQFESFLDLGYLSIYKAADLRIFKLSFKRMDSNSDKQGQYKMTEYRLQTTRKNKTNK